MVEYLYPKIPNVYGDWQVWKQNIIKLKKRQWARSNPQERSRVGRMLDSTGTTGDNVFDDSGMSVARGRAGGAFVNLQDGEPVVRCHKSVLWGIL